MSSEGPIFGNKTAKMDESLGDSGCGDGCAGYQNNGYPIHNSNNHRHRNMPLADALDLSNRFFQQSGKPNWKRERENPLQMCAHVFCYLVGSCLPHF